MCGRIVHLPQNGLAAPQHFRQTACGNDLADVAYHRLYRRDPLEGIVRLLKCRIMP